MPIRDIRGDIRSATDTKMNIAEMGFSIKIHGLPCEITKERRNLLSIIGPITSARTKGAISNWNLRATYPKTPNPIMSVTSTWL